MLITIEQAKQIELRIEQLETRTDAEIVCVVSSRCDDYYYIPALWAAIVALISPLPFWFTPWWHQTTYVVLAQMVAFVAAWGLFRSPKVLIHFIPKDVRQWRASNLAKRSFLENKLHHTANRKGVLLFVAEAEKYVEIFADEGIAKLINDTQWESIIASLIEQIGQGRTYDGLQQCLEKCDELLAKHAPATSPKNELPNRLVMLNP